MPKIAMNSDKKEKEKPKMVVAFMVKRKVIGHRSAGCVKITPECSKTPHGFIKESELD
jgi:hypothetical protein